MSEQAFVSLSPPLVLLLSFPFSLSPSSPPSFRLSRVILLHRQRETEPETETGIPGYGASVKLGISFEELLQPRHREVGGAKGGSERAREEAPIIQRSQSTELCLRAPVCMCAGMHAGRTPRQAARAPRRCWPAGAPRRALAPGTNLPCLPVRAPSPTCWGEMHESAYACARARISKAYGKGERGRCILGEKQPGHWVGGIQRACPTQAARRAAASAGASPRAAQRHTSAGPPMRGSPLQTMGKEDAFGRPSGREHKSRSV